MNPRPISFQDFWYSDVLKNLSKGEAMQKRIPLVFYFLLLISSCVVAKTFRQRMVIETEEKINQIIFKHIIESGVSVKDVYLINGVAVSKEEYAIRIQKAEQEEQEMCRKMEEERIYAKVEFISTTQLQIYKKMLSKTFIEVKQWLAKLEMPIVSEYYVFSTDTIASKGAFESFKNDLFLKAQSLFDEYTQLQDVLALQKLLDQYEKVPYRLERFFQNSVQQAINHCDDTKILKELLSLLGSAD